MDRYIVVSRGSTAGLAEELNKLAEKGYGVVQFQHVHIPEGHPLNGRDVYTAIMEKQPRRQSA